MRIFSLKIKFKFLGRIIREKRNIFCINRVNGVKFAFGHGLLILLEDDVIERNIQWSSSKTCSNMCVHS